VNSVALVAEVVPEAHMEGRYLRVPSTQEVIRWGADVPGRYHRKKDDSWLFPATPSRVLELKQLGIRISPDLWKWAENELNPPSTIQIENIPGLLKTPFVFQWEGIEFLESRKGRALLSDEQGLGKTIQALSWLKYHSDAFPALVVVPASVKINWKREAAAWVHGVKVDILEGMRPGTLPQMDVLIGNFEILEARTDDLIKWGIKTLIVDECHRIKNPSAKCSKAAYYLSQHCEHVIGMSGTPVVNRPSEFFNILRMIRPGLFPSHWEYINRYCGARMDNGKQTFDGATHTQELHDILRKTIMIRRLKQDVLKDLPPKSRSVIPIPTNNKKEYHQAKVDFIGWLEKVDPEKADKASKAIALTRIEKLKQLSTAGKMKLAVEWIENFITSEKLVVFTTHHRPVDDLVKHFGNKTVVIDGRVNLNQRQQAQDRFNKDSSCRILIAQLKSGGVGLNLQWDCANVAFLELGWTPGDHDQAEDRVHRIGQTRQCGIYYLIGENTIEEQVMEMLDTKRAMLHQILNGGEAPEEGMLTFLLRKLKDDVLCGNA